MQAEYIDKKYKEHRGTVVEKYRRLFGGYILVIEEKGVQTKVRVGQTVFADTPLGATLTVGELNGKLINIRPGVCKNTDEE